MWCLVVVVVVVVDNPGAMAYTHPPKHVKPANRGLKKKSYIRVHGSHKAFAAVRLEGGPCLGRAASPSVFMYCTAGCNAAA